MTTFDSREKSAEGRFAYDEELRFKAAARRNKLVGVWAAERLGKAGDEALVYVRAIVTLDLRESGDEDVFRKLRKDFDVAGVSESDDSIRHMLVVFQAQAVREISEGI